MLCLARSSKTDLVSYKDPMRKLIFSECLIKLTLAINKIHGTKIS